MIGNLAAFLEHPGRPARSLRYHELQGFLFAVACGPELVMPSEWLPVAVGDQDAGFETPEEAQAVLQDVMALYDAINASVRSDRPTLPPDCCFRRKTLANLDKDAPISQWSRGFAQGHHWLSEDWEPCIPEAFDREFGALLMTLCFFGSREVAESVVHELGRGEDALEPLARDIRQVFPDAVAEYARMARSVQRVLNDHRADLVAAPTPGRNEPCPCGSGRKYKKCCGAN